MKKKKVTQHYVDNKKFLEEMTKFRNKVLKAQDSGRKRPMVTNYIGECFLKIANGLSYRPNFINYTYRAEMVSDGIENCLQYIHNFDPDKSNNPFAYFTQIIYYAFLRRIQKEKKQQHIKNQMIEKQQYELYTVNDGDDTVYDIGGFDPDIMLPEEDVYKPKKKSPTDLPEGLEEYMTENKDEDSTDN